MYQLLYSIIIINHKNSYSRRVGGYIESIYIIKWREYIGLHLKKNYCKFIWKCLFLFINNILFCLQKFYICLRLIFFLNGFYFKKKYIK